MEGGENAMNDLIQRSFGRFPMISFPSFMEDIEDLLPTANLLNGLSVSEDDKNVYVEASVPGVDLKDVEVTFSKGMLTIKGEKEEEDRGKTYHRRATRSFFYRVTPGDVDPKAAPQATCKNGIMTVTFAKVPEEKPKKIAVKTA